MNAKILLVEDDVTLGFVIKDNLEQFDFEVTLCADGEAGEIAFAQQRFDLCVLDVMLPKKDGFALAKEIRKKSSVPILFLTAKAMTEDKLEGFRAGGDDYISKPFSWEELVARIDVFLRRTNAAGRNDLYEVGDFIFDYKRFKLIHPRGEKNLTQKETEVMKLLCTNRNRILKREEILKEVWGDDDYFRGRSLDVFISKLRKYLKDDPCVEIVNYHSIGFRMEVNK